MAGRMESSSSTCHQRLLVDCLPCQPLPRCAPLHSLLSALVAARIVPVPTFMSGLSSAVITSRVAFPQTGPQASLEASPTSVIHPSSVAGFTAWCLLPVPNLRISTLHSIASSNCKTGARKTEVGQVWTPNTHIKTGHNGKYLYLCHQCPGDRSEDRWISEMYWPANLAKLMGSRLSEKACL